VHATVNALYPLSPEESPKLILEACVRESLEELISFGDLLEAPDPDSDRRGAIMIHVAPPRLVQLGSDQHLLVGLAPDNASVLPPEFEACIDSRGALRVVKTDALVGQTDELIATSGLPVLSVSDWAHAPPQVPPSDVVARLRTQLEQEPPCGNIPDLNVLDPAADTKYYRDRWRRPSGLCGDFVARRPVPYGAPRWCFVRYVEGVPERLLDLPLQGSRHRGCDDAWLLQAAIDANRGAPQWVEESRNRDDTSTLRFFHPVPSWAERYWAAAGERVPSSGCLFAYRFDRGVLERVREFARSRLWLEFTTDTTH